MAKANLYFCFLTPDLSLELTANRNDLAFSSKETNH